MNQENHVIAVWHGAVHGEDAVSVLASARIMRIQDLRLPVETRLTVAVTPWTSTAYGLELRP